ncbi:hypothetical protein [Aeromicrobium fastidiosum]|uniref:Uncharacterized protein n=1 Tax=Aeromicrobium fastidiosum TaxID=52699 RepID=A0A641AUC6_9ACTN|nr:hypothetical protein [Aeromicrobium fastidiosum]KAA1380458.1 hypothetical protein ESP62_004570 [Aeromicrobium fastidiosum]MBP2390039.1 hypothetical protein [Aeromicrobium fastidiosum]
MESTEHGDHSECAVSRHPAWPDHSAADRSLVPRIAAGVAVILLVAVGALEMYQGDGVVIVGSHTQGFFQFWLAGLAVLASAVAFIAVLNRAAEAEVWGARFWRPVVTAAAFVVCPILVMLATIVAQVADLGEYTRLSGPRGADEYVVRVGPGLGQWPLQLYRSTGWLRYEELDVPLVMTGSPRTFSDGYYSVRRTDDRLVLEYPPAGGGTYTKAEHVLLPMS